MLMLDGAEARNLELSLSTLIEWIFTNQTPLLYDFGDAARDDVTAHSYGY